ncbi:MAG: hypothetical protein ACOCWR_09145 [Oceanidesulfovibrio sp.]
MEKKLSNEQPLRGDDYRVPVTKRTASVFIGLAGFVCWVVFAVFALYGVSRLVETNSWLGFPGLVFIMVGGGVTFFAVTKYADKWLAKRGKESD